MLKGLGSLQGLSIRRATGGFGLRAVPTATLNSNLPAIAKAPGPPSLNSKRPNVSAFGNGDPIPNLQPHLIPMNPKPNKGNPKRLVFKAQTLTRTAPRYNTMVFKAQTLTRTAPRYNIVEACPEEIRNPNTLKPENPKAQSPKALKP